MLPSQDAPTPSPAAPAIQHRPSAPRQDGTPASARTAAQLDALPAHRAEASPSSSVPGAALPQPAPTGPVLTGAAPGARAASPGAQLGQFVVQHAPKGVVHAELTLHPESLGTVQIQLQLDANGALKALVLADPTALGALNADLDSLRQALDAAGVQLGGLDIQARSEGRPQADRDPAAQALQLTVRQSASGLTLPGAPVSHLPIAALISGGARLDLHL